MIRGKECVRALRGARRIFVTSAALVAFVAAGSQDADSRRAVVNPAGASPVSSSSAREAAVATSSAGSSVRPAPLYAVPTSPFIHDSRRGTFVPDTVSDARHISLSNGIEIDTEVGEPALPSALHLDAAPTDRPGYHIIQFAGPIRDSWRAELESTGVTIVGYLPEYAYLIRADAAQLDAARNPAYVVWSGLYQPAYKVSAQPEMAASSGRQIALLVLFPGESLTDISAEVAALGGAVLETGPRSFGSSPGRSRNF